MRRSRFSEEQIIIIGILKEHQAGRGVAELFLKYPFQSELVRQSREGEGIGRARAD